MKRTILALTAGLGIVFAGSACNPLVPVQVSNAPAHVPPGTVWGTNPTPAPSTSPSGCASSDPRNCWGVPPTP